MQFKLVVKFASCSAKIGGGRDDARVARDSQSIAAEARSTRFAMAGLDDGILSTDLRGSTKRQANTGKLRSIFPKMRGRKSETCYYPDKIRKKDESEIMVGRDHTLPSSKAQ